MHIPEIWGYRTDPESDVEVVILLICRNEGNYSLQLKQQPTNKITTMSNGVTHLHTCTPRSRNNIVIIDSMTTNHKNITNTLISMH